MTICLAIVLQVILIGVPSSIRRPHRLITQPRSLQCHPRYLRSSDILLVYSSSLSKTAVQVNQPEPLYTTFVVYFMDYRPPIILTTSMTFTVFPEGSTSGSLVEKKYFISKNSFLKRERTFKTLRQPLSQSLHNGKIVFSNCQLFEEFFFDSTII
jgi:hypothetical protein